MTARAAGTPTARRVSVRRSAVIRQIRDIEAVRMELERSRPYAAYPLAYLDKRMFGLAEFYEATAGDRRALVMHARGGLGPSTFSMGDASLVGTLLSLHPGPRQAFFTCESEHVERILTTHNVWRPQTMLRMQLTREDFRLPADLSGVRRLIAADAVDLNRLYNEESTRYTGRQIIEGVYFGAHHRGWLVAAAGTHIYSRREGVAVIGNVFTHPDFRGHGLGSADYGGRRDPPAPGLRPRRAQRRPGEPHRAPHLRADGLQGDRPPHRSDGHAAPGLFALALPAPHPRPPPVDPARNRARRALSRPIGQSCSCMPSGLPLGAKAQPANTPSRRQPAGHRHSRSLSQVLVPAFLTPSRCTESRARW